MERHMTLAAGVASLACLLALASCSAPQAEPASSAQEPASAAASDIPATDRIGAFQAATLDGGTFTFDDIASKDVTVVNFWQTTCPPCIAEMPDLAEFAARLPENVQVVTFCFDGQSKAQTALDIVERTGWTGTTLVDADSSLLSFCYKIQYTPTTVFIARDGSVVGELLVGASSDLEGTYLERINDVLAWEGKPTIALDGKA